MKNLRTTLLFLSVLSLPVWAASDEPLITLAESQAEQGRLNQSILVAKSVPQPGAPQINLLEPVDPGNIVVTPFPVRLQFSTEGGANVIPSSLRVYYGAFGINITDRLLKRARFENNELRIDSAEVPSGKHRLLVSIVDSHNRSTEKLLTLIVK
ncbi:hypothetical protein ACFFKC_08695 [Pseudoduganella danionis]|uniref:Uncharacterized protein n=1 Tax=Pseudoduganella danionis TaxID=1890295 RepID=A0ABW9SSN3_9BURK|nr:hypothetical protein [Pseudoduganella danionis]MTW34845.1 hypothetical protein [Pseudoduganella danionis]